MRSTHSTRVAPRAAAFPGARVHARDAARTVVAVAALLALVGCSDRDDASDLSDVSPVGVGGPLGPLGPVDAPAPGEGLVGVDGIAVDDNDGIAADDIDGVAADDNDGIAVDDIDGQLPANDDPAPRPFGPVDVPGDTRNISGLFDASIDGPLGTDLRYVQITGNGTFVLFDYDLDPYGTGLNCFRDGRPLPLVRDRGDDYLLDGRSVLIARETLGIGFGFTDTLDDDRDGDFTEFLYYRFPRVSGLSTVDFGVCR